jgi:hypothetical protein
VGDDQMALTAGERLAPLLDGIEDPSSARVPAGHGRGRRGSTATSTRPTGRRSHWSSSGPGRAVLDGARRVHRRPGGDDRRPVRRRAAPPDRDARPGRAARQPLAAAVSRVYLGTLAVAQGRLEEARAPMDEGLELSLAAHSTRGVTLCLPRSPGWRSSRVTSGGRRCWRGRPTGLRRRVGLRPWPLLRRDEAELADQVRQALGRPVRRAVRRRLPAQPAGGGGRRAVHRRRLRSRLENRASAGHRNPRSGDVASRRRRQAGRRPGRARPAGRRGPAACPSRTARPSPAASWTGSAASRSVRAPRC